MNNSSQILNLIGWSGLDILILVMGLLILVLLVLIIIQMNKLKKMKSLLDQFMTGSDAKSLEEEIAEVIKDIKLLKKADLKESDMLDDIYEKLRFCFHKIGLVKYDAFHEMGGKLSFILCMLNEDNNGYIINTVNSNSGCYSYAKEIKNGDPGVEIGEEEQSALNMALNSAKVRVKKDGNDSEN